MKTVIIKRPSIAKFSDWYDALIVDSKSIAWGTGPTPEEALGDLICDHYEELGLRFDPDIREAMSASARPAMVFIGYLAQLLALAEIFNFEIEVREGGDEV